MLARRITATAILLAGLGASSASAGAATTLPSSITASAGTTYYAFVGPYYNLQAVRFLKVVGTRVYEVGVVGSETFTSTGQLRGHKWKRTTKIEACAGKPATTKVTYRKTKGSPTDLKISGYKRVAGPTTSIGEIDDWYFDHWADPANPYLSTVPEIFDSFRQTNWTNYCS